MHPADKEKQRLRVIAGAMCQLIPNQNFQEFISVLREQREMIVRDIATEGTLVHERILLTTIGELRALDNIIAVYDDYKRRESI
jgi:hypothetical protein